MFSKSDQLRNTILRTFFNMYAPALVFRLCVAVRCAVRGARCTVRGAQALERERASLVDASRKLDLSLGENDQLSLEIEEAKTKARPVKSVELCVVRLADPNPFCLLPH